MYMPINSLGYSCIKKLQRDNLLHAYNEPINLYSEGINQRYLKNCADVAGKYALAVPKNLGLGLNFRLCSEGYFFSGHP